ncbi:helix-turn-helix domain-containing protein [Deinococcus planocerae]|uniref:helix-turn-helix domain-containing protein n=1 Tax=Deinococcus planocerae TaxID=1737569 RepID=UPI000C7F32E3|nr:helix-turn-helix transcriptional regulator [Deinococcus planocerae]
MPRIKKTPNPSPLRRLFGQRLRAERHAQELTLEDVAEAADMNWSYIAQVERGERNVSIDNMTALAGAVGRQLYELLMPDEQMGT